MKKTSLSLILFLPILALLSALYWSGVASVPFHPDESTQIFMSADVEMFARDPSSLFWRADRAADPRQRYHLLDAPLTRYLIGTARQIMRAPAIPVDWDWSKTWAENEKAGALPSPNLLLVSRMAIAGLYPFSILLLFLTARRVFNPQVAWIAALLLAINALILLHTRRAMAEGTLIFTLNLTLWALVTCEKRPWLVALPAALAFCAKQSLIALAPLGLVAIFWQPAVTAPISRKIRQTAIYLVLYGLVVFLLNPYLWQQPIGAGMAAIHERENLAAAQTADRPEQTLNSPALRLVAVIGGVYLSPPIFHEVGNYVDQTRVAEEEYLNSPWNSLFRSIPPGGLLLALNLSGFIFALKDFRRRLSALILLAGLFQTLITLVTTPLPWQRYYLPLVPFACIWIAYGIETIRTGFWRAAQKSRSATRPSPT